MLAPHGFAEAGEVLRQRLGVVGEVAVGSAVEQYAAHPELLQQTRHDERAHGVDGVHDHGEPCLAHGVGVDGLECEHRVDVLVGEVVVLNVSELVDGDEVEIAAVGYLQYLIAFGRGKELPLGVQQLQRVPLAGVVAGGDDDSAVGSGEAHRKFGGGGRRKPASDHVEAAGYQSAADQLLHHRAADARVPAHDDLEAAAFRSGVPAQALAVCVCELDYIHRRESFAAGPAYGSAYARN